MLVMLFEILLSAGCAFYNTYPTYTNLEQNVVVKASVDFTGDIFKTELRSRGNLFGNTYNNYYAGHTQSATYEWQDPDAEYFKDRIESAGILTRAPNPQYTIDVKRYNNGEQNPQARWLTFLGSLTLIGRTQNLYFVKIRIYEKSTGELIAQKLTPFTGFTLRFCGPIFGALVDRDLDTPTDNQVTSWYLQCADYAISEIQKHQKKKKNPNNP